jgi:hypothetical protein
MRKPDICIFCKHYDFCNNKYNFKVPYNIDYCRNKLLNMEERIFSKIDLYFQNQLETSFNIVKPYVEKLKYVNTITNGDLFICGSVGSGKDTIVNYLKNNLGYAKFRNASTIKDIILSINNIDNEKLEILKREKKELRQAHIDISTWLNNQCNRENPLWDLNHLSLIITNRTIEFDIINDLVKYPKVISDIRMLNEMILLLELGWKGVFLTGTSKENHHPDITKNDKTEILIHYPFKNKYGDETSIFKELQLLYGKNMFLLDNAGTKYDSLYSIKYEDLVPEFLDIFRKMTATLC